MVQVYPNTVFETMNSDAPQQDNLQQSLFGDSPVTSKRKIKPKEPLYSLLMTSSDESLRYLFTRLSDFSEDGQLVDYYPEVALTRREYLEQVMLALRHRREWEE